MILVDGAQTGVSEILSPSVSFVQQHVLWVYSPTDQGSCIVQNLADQKIKTL
jgi:hypothetical protein